MIARRGDPVAIANPPAVELQKPQGERGWYQDPLAYGQPGSMGVDHAALERARAIADEDRLRALPGRG